MAARRCKSIAFLIGLMLLASGNLGHSAETELDVIAPSFPPLQMYVDGEAKGYVVDLVLKALDKVKEKLPLTVKGPRSVPWRRAIVTAQKQPNTMLFSLSRTPAREDKYIWIAEVSPYEIYFFGLEKNKSIEVTDLESLLNSELKVGVQAGSNSQELLERRGFVKDKDFVTYPDFTLGVRMLFKNRFAMLPLTSFVGRATICRQGYDADQVKPVFRLGELSKPLWLVFSKGSDERLIELFRTAISDLKRDKIDDVYRRAYLADWERSNCAD